LSLGQNLKKRGCLGNGLKTAFTPYDELNLKPPGEAVGALDYISSP